MEKKITPEEVVEIYKKHGNVITLQEAKNILAFMCEMANMALNQIIINES